MNARESRFLGSGNAWTGDDHRYRGWKLICACGETKIITTHKDKSLPPEAVVKKFIVAGWYVGKRAADDQCGRCIHKSKEKEKPFSTGRILRAIETVQPELVAPAVVPEPVIPTKPPTEREVLILIDASIAAGLRQLEENNTKSARKHFLAARDGVVVAKNYLDMRLRKKSRAVPKEQHQPILDDPNYEQWLASL